MQCDRCAGEHFTQAGRSRHQRQLYQCRACGRRMTTRSTSVCSGYRVPDAVIALAVRWYLRYRLRYDDVVEWLAERGIHVDASTIYDWVRAFTPCFIAAARVHRSPVGHRWRVDETYSTVGKSWHYLFRAIDEHGQLVDVYLSDRRNAAAAQALFKAAIAASGASPTPKTTDKAKCYPPALRTLLPNVDHRRSKYLNNGLERDHQHLKGRIRPMRSFKPVDSASTFSRGHAVVRNLRRGFSTLTAAVAVPLRLVTAWTALAATL